MLQQIARERAISEGLSTTSRVAISHAVFVRDMNPPFQAQGFPRVRGPLCEPL